MILYCKSESRGQEIVQMYFRAVVFNRGYAKTSYVRGYVDYTICITCIMYQQLWGTNLKRNYIWGYANKKG
jgi:hypothetical protein